MLVHRCRRYSLPAAVACSDNRGTRDGDCRTPGFRGAGTRCLIAAAILLVSMPCATAATRSPRAKVVNLEQLHSQAALIGQEVEVVSCAGVSMSDAPHSRNLIVIYPCRAELAEDVERAAVVGRLSAQTVLKSFNDWTAGDSAAFKGRFRGILKKELLDPGDTEEVLVVELDEAEFHSAVDP